MKQQLFLFLSSILLIFTACENQSKHSSFFKGDFLKSHTFDKIIEVDLEPVCFGEDIHFGMVTFRIIENKYLIEYRKQDFLLRVYDAQNNVSQEIFRVGNGPYEFQMIDYLNSHTNQNDEVISHFFDLNSGNIFKFNMNEYLSTKKFLAGYVTAEKPNSSCHMPVILNDSTTLYTVFNQIDNQMYLTAFGNSDNGVKYSIKISQFDFDYPYGNSHFAIVKHPTENKVALATYFLDQIVILDLDSNKSVIFSDNNDLGDWNSIKNSDNLPYTYLDAIIVEDKIFALHSTIQENKSEIHVLDWNGKPISKIMLSDWLENISYDKNKGMLYGANYEEEIYKFDLTGII